MRGSIQLQGLQLKKDMALLEWVQRATKKMIRGLDGLLYYEERLKKLVLLILEKERLQEDLKAAFQ